MNGFMQRRIWVEPMTREEFLGIKKPLVIHYSFQTVPGGRVLVASTPKGVCFLMPAAHKWLPEETLKSHFPHARLRHRSVELHKKAAWLLKQRCDKVRDLCLHLYGTPFQLDVWRDLLQIPAGKVTTYLNIAKRIHRPKAARPVGQAVSANPVMYIVPCHRVVCTNGKLGGYHWGIVRKVKYLNMEAHIAPKENGLKNWEPTLF